MIHEIKAECGSCGASGVYRGFAEPKGVAVVCLTCGGEGWVIRRIKEFKKRRVVDNVDVVAQSAGTLICAGVGPQGSSRVTYAEFLIGVRP